MSVAAYGYDYIAKNDKVPEYYEINEAEARVVKMIFDWIDILGLSVKEVVRKLQEMGVNPRKSERGVWATSTLSTLLKNTAHIGQARWGRSCARKEPG